MARSPKEAIVIVLDVGKPVAQDCDSSGTSFLDKARQCVSMILQRKVFSDSKDEIGLILMGTEDSVNNLDYKHISIASNLQLATWDVIQSVELETKPSPATADWLDAIVVALDFLREQAEGKKFTEWKLVLLSNFDTMSDTEQVGQIVQTFKDLQVSLVVIGPDIDQSQETQSGIKLIQHIVSEVDGLISNFEDALQQLMFYQNKSARPTPWNVVMDIGSIIKIPVSGYRKITSTALPTWKKAVTGDFSAPLQEKSYHKDDEMQTEVERSNVINGYLFGSTKVPMNDVDEEAMGYHSGPRALSVLGFTSRSNIQRHYLVGDCTYYFTAQKSNQGAAEALAALTRALSELDMVAIVRKVYNNNYAPVMGVLFPKERHSSSSSQVLVFAPLPFSEDMREFIFPSLSRLAKKTEEKTAAVDQLIEAMSLEGDMLEPEELADPFRQHWYSCLSQRVLRPSEPLPKLAPHLAELLQSPLQQQHEHLADTLAKELEKNFKLDVVSRQSRRAAANIFKSETGSDEAGGDSQPVLEVKPLIDQLSRDIVQVGTLTPAEDFIVLLKQGEPFPTVCEQMSGVIEKLVTCSFGQDDYNKAVEAMKVMRNKCKEVNPQPYNKWLPQFNKMLLDNHKTSFITLLVQGELGPISIDENPSSDVSVDEAGKFFEESNTAHATTAEDDVDEEDLFNQM